ncbi:hypothetical protein LZ30DRAFT_403017 [Colletotrichum cereale]|nr:hypothetical protein LZ30DRAFT_403017 [Colletotrichum cereale]
MGMESGYHPLTATRRQRHRVGSKEVLSREAGGIRTPGQTTNGLPVVANMDIVVLPAGASASLVTPSSPLPSTSSWFLTRAEGRPGAGQGSLLALRLVQPVPGSRQCFLESNNVRVSFVLVWWRWRTWNG